MQSTLKHRWMACKIKVESQKTGQFRTAYDTHIGEVTTMNMWLTFPAVTSCSCQCQHRQMKQPFRNLWHHNHCSNVYIGDALFHGDVRFPLFWLFKINAFSLDCMSSPYRSKLLIHWHTEQTMLCHVVWLCQISRDWFVTDKCTA